MTWPVPVLAVLAGDLRVYRDVSVHAERGRPVVLEAGNLVVDTPAAWALGCLVLSVFFLPAYLVSRRNTG